MTACLTLDKRVLHRVILPGALAAAMVTAASGLAHARPAPASFADIAARVGPAVVNIATDRGTAPAMLGKSQDMPQSSPFGQPEGQFREFMERFFGGKAPDFRFGEPLRPEHRMSAVGSGFIVDKDGYVVTNNHVVAGARSVRVRLHDGETFDAKLIGGDAKTDLALLKIDAGRPLPFVEFGDSDRIRAGDWVMTIGNPFGLGGSVTAGIVSARGRDLRGGSLVDFLQIDAPINQGSSGGPAFDADGKVIGVNASIYSPNGGNVGIGFAIPSNDARQVIAALKADGRIERGWLGVQIQPVTPDIAESIGMKDAAGALVASVAETGPARDAGLLPGRHHHQVGRRRGGQVARSAAPRRRDQDGQGGRAGDPSRGQGDDALGHHRADAPHREGREPARQDRQERARRHRHHGRRYRPRGAVPLRARRGGQGRPGPPCR